VLEDGALEYNDDRFTLSPGVIQIGIQSYKDKSGFLKMLQIVT